MKLYNIKGKTEAEFLAILKPYADTQELSGFQWVYRFFTGKLKERRISVIAERPAIALRDEDNTPICWDVPVSVEIVTDKKATTNEEHDDLVATVAQAIMGGDATCAALNAAASKDGFRALKWTFGDGPDDSIDDQLRKSKLTGTLLMRPVDVAA